METSASWLSFHICRNALIRGLKVKEQGLGSFWVDMPRIVIYILLPLNLVISLLLVGGGVIQNLKGAETAPLVEPVAVSAEGEILEGAVIDTEAEIITEQFVPMGPAASQVAIKQSGTNGGGFMGVNSAHPLENPNAFTNLMVGRTPEFLGKKIELYEMKWAVLVCTDGRFLGMFGEKTVNVLEVNLMLDGILDD